MSEHILLPHHFCDFKIRELLTLRLAGSAIDLQNAPDRRSTTASIFVDPEVCHSSFPKYSRHLHDDCRIVFLSSTLHLITLAYLSILPTFKAPPFLPFGRLADFMEPRSTLQITGYLRHGITTNKHFGAPFVDMAGERWVPKTNLTQS